MNILFGTSIVVLLVLAVWRMFRRALPLGGWVAWSSLLLAIVPNLGALAPSAWA